MAAPNASLFAEILSRESRWYVFGTFLGVPSHELDSINSNYRLEGTSRCLIEMHNCMAQQDNKPTWTSIESALRRMGNIAMANGIKSKYIKESSTSHKGEGNSTSNSNGATPTTTPLRVSNHSNRSLSESIRASSSELCQALMVSNTTLDSLTIALYSKGVIDRDSKRPILDPDKGLRGPDLLLDLVCHYLDGSETDSNRFTVVMECLEAQEHLRDIVIKIKDRLI